MKIIFGGHWSSPPDGWTAYNESQVDITKPLDFADNSVDVVFTEHVIEHVTLPEAIGFMRESLRILKPGGIFRCVAPFVDKMLRYEGRNELDQRYATGLLAHFFEEDDAALKAVGLKGIESDPVPFFWANLLKGHLHKFVWSTELMARVLGRVGFTSCCFHEEPGCSSFDQSTAIERTVRGLFGDLSAYGSGFAYDPESSVVEARK